MPYQNFQNAVDEIRSIFVNQTASYCTDPYPHPEVVRRSKSILCQTGELSFQIPRYNDDDDRSSVSEPPEPYDPDYQFTWTDFHSPAHTLVRRENQMFPNNVGWLPQEVLKAATHAEHCRGTTQCEACSEIVRWKDTTILACQCYRCKPRIAAAVRDAVNADRFVAPQCCKINMTTEIVGHCFDFDLYRAFINLEPDPDFAPW